MNRLADPNAADRPSRTRLFMFYTFVLIDAAAVLGLVRALVGALAAYNIVGSDVAICGVPAIVCAAFLAGAMLVKRRGRVGLATGLAAVPAIPTVLAMAALAVFMATFRHQP